MPYQGVGGARIGDETPQRLIELGEGLQRLAQFVARCPQKALASLIRPVGKIAHGVYRIARDDQFPLDPLAVGHVAHGGCDQRPAHVFDGA